MKVDIVIIGAGIAGLSTASKLNGLNNLSLVLIEGKDVGSNNPSPLTFLNVAKDFDLVDCCKEDYASFAFHNYQGSSIEYGFGDSELVVLDYKRACAKLFEKLNSSGRQAVYINQHVTNLYQHEDRVLVHLDDNTQIQSKIVIDASGKSQFVAGVYKRDDVHYYSHVCGGVFSNVRNPKKKLCCFLLPNSDFGSGGGWFYSIGDNKASFGYATISNSPNPDYGKLRENFERASKKFEPYSQYLADSKLEYIELGVIPISYVNKFVDGKIIIVGDAAGMATNWMCMGIEPALRYGKHAGEIAAEALFRNDFTILNKYQDLWEKDNKHTFDLAAKNATVFWFSDHYFWEWIIKNDLAFLSPEQLLDRLRRNSHVLKWYHVIPRAISYRILTLLDKNVNSPRHIVKGNLKLKSKMVKQYLYLISDKVIPDRFGAKGKNLQTLWTNNFDIPLTLCLTVEAYNDYIRINQIERKIREILKRPDMTTNEKSAKIKDLIVSSNIPDEIHVEFIENGYLHKMDSKWAIRSSSNMEDLPGLSFAGLYESYLNVQGLEQILEMVKRCWASLWNERAILYREKHDLDHMNASMAVVIQQMISPHYSGVVFTQGPTDATSDEMLFEYCEGLGEGLVSGRITPHMCRIHRNTCSITHLNDEDKGRLSNDQLKRLAQLASTIEECFGSPQDIEWAYDGVAIKVLQSRPIYRATDRQSASLDKVWTRANVGEVLPDVVTPLTWAIFRTILSRPDMSKETDADETSRQGADQIALIKGRGYIRLDLFLDSFCYLPFVTPEIMDLVLGVKMPTNVKNYKRPSGIAVAAAQGLFLLALSGILPRLSLMAKGLPDLSEARTGGLEKIIEWNRLCFRVHLKGTAYAIGAFAFLVHCLRRWLPIDVEELIPLIMIGNADLQTAAQGTTLLDLARHINRHPALSKLIFDHQDWKLLERQVGGIDGGIEFLSLLKDFLIHNGARAAGEFELALPRWRENPSFVVMLIKKFLGASALNFVFPDRKLRLEKHEKAVCQIGDQLTLFKRWIFFRLLDSYRKFSTLRENMKYHLMEGYGELRNYFLAAGKTLVDESVLRQSDDVFFLEPHEVEELVSAQRVNGTIDRLVGERKQQYEMLNQEPAPDLVFHGMFTDNPRPAGNMSGIGCSPGVSEGFARVLKDISEAKLLEPGEILIASHTDPGWTPLFLICKGLVAETGGFLSHGATVAREYGIPAVVSVPGATEKIQTGDLVVVDGSSGVVTIINKDIDMQRLNEE